MFQYYLVFGLLVIEFIVLTLLLIPLPEAILNLIINMMDKFKIPLRITLAVLLFFTVDQTLEMRREEERHTDMPTNASLDKDTFAKSRKFRAERNFYLCAFTFSLFVITLRVQSILRRMKGYQKELEVMRRVKSQ
eukprot:TRINITY_DN12012_c0_g1_i1.p1 TRINITY_DN12012_c0_g1~~TRINITY_DN12012_c0_g1_i1.p1  ORF type:complete len:135 (+),score=21.42 TRINITY_DN12012_c0_g1_i1:134-538(+)